MDHAFGCRVSIELSIILSPGLHGYIRHGGGLQRSEEPEHLSVGVDMTGLYNKKKPKKSLQFEIVIKSDIIAYKESISEH